MFIDSHCHLHMLEFNELYENLDAVIDDCDKNEIEHLLCVAVDLQQFPELLSIAEKYPNVSISAGVHPKEDVYTAGPYDISAEVLRENLFNQASHSRVIAIGETGLDYYRTTDSASIENQISRLKTHIEVATELKKPLIIHTRNAQEDTIKYLDKFNAKAIGGVMHCFTEDWEMAKKALDLGFYISISGIVTFKNAAQVQDVATKVPLDRLLIETDCPYLAPMPFRGKTNYPQYVKYVAMKIAELRGIEFAEVAKQSTQNFYDLFNFKS